MARARRPRQSHTGALLDVRTALVLLLGTLCGVAAGVLAVLTGHTPAGAALAGCIALAAGVRFAHRLIG